MFRTSGTIEADNIDAHCNQRGHDRCDICAEQHTPTGVERDLGLNGYSASNFLHGTAKTSNCRSDFQKVLTGLNEQEINATLQQTNRLFVKYLCELLIG